MAETAVPVWGNELEYYLNTGTAGEPAWVKVTELLSWESNTEAKTYEPSWLDRKVAPKFTLGASCSITWTKDTLKGGQLEAWAMEHRNDADVACEVCRVFTWIDGTGEGTKCADKAAFLFNAADPSNATAGQPVVTGGTLNMVDDGWVEGSWNTTGLQFNAA